MEDVSDDDLMRLHCDGDAEAFETLFARYHVPVYNFARAVLGDGAGPEEVLQETFLAVARHAKGYTPRGRFRAWLMRIARNLCLNQLQAQRVRRAVMAQGEFAFIEPTSQEAGPAERVDANEQAGIVRAAIGELPDNQREAIALYAFERMSYREIAEVMDTPINTVKTLIHRARASLARALQPRLEE